MTAARICRIERTGGPEVIGWADVELGAPGPDQILVCHTAVGVNYIDTYFRAGVYPMPLPGSLGSEAAGVVEAVGPGVTGFAVGDRVAYFAGAPGSYGTHRIIPTLTPVKLPDSIDDRTAAAVMLKGCTAEMLIERCAKVQAGETVLVHAVAGGVGLLLTQWLKAIGARVIGTTSTAEKAALAKSYGCDEVVLYTKEPFQPKVMALTGGKGVRVVIDGIGKDTFEDSVKCLSPRGMMVSYGNASGVIGQIDFGLLSRQGSCFATRPGLFHYYATRPEVEAGAARLFEMLASGKVKVRIDQTFPLTQAADAHRALEGRATTGSTVLVP
jgi:NADPH2:quinone reductase